MLNATDRIKVVEVDVNSIQNAGQQRQQCPLSFKKHILIKLLKMQYPSSGEGWPARGIRRELLGCFREKVNSA